jgi:hypothetical protein
MSDNEIYLLIKYVKIVLWGVAKRLSYIEDARCLKVKTGFDKNGSKYREYKKLLDTSGSVFYHQ